MERQVNQTMARRLPAGMERHGQRQRHRKQQSAKQWSGNSNGNSIHLTMVAIQRKEAYNQGNNQTNKGMKQQHNNQPKRRNNGFQQHGNGNGNGNGNIPWSEIPSKKEV
jgi:hypothetical protein